MIKNIPLDISGFEELCKQYQPKGIHMVEVTERLSALGDIASKCSCTWGAGQKFGDTGWIQLASPSKRHKEDTRTIFVCKASLIA